MQITEKLAYRISTKSGEYRIDENSTYGLIQTRLYYGLI
jgi:hypothetical protein